MKQVLLDFNQVIGFSDQNQVTSVSSEVVELKLTPLVGPSVFINQELLQFIESIGLPASILSASVFLLKHPTVKDHLSKYIDHIFLSKDLGLAKDLPATYITMATKLNCQPSDIIFIDDQLHNVTAAEQVGCTGIVFHNNAELLSQLTTAIQKR